MRCLPPDDPTVPGPELRTIWLTRVEAEECIVHGRLSQKGEVRTGTRMVSDQAEGAALTTTTGRTPLFWTKGWYLLCKSRW